MPGEKGLKFDLLVITGPTASGKTALAASVAAELGAEIISADSRQVYREMNLGTGKDYSDYIVNGRRIPCHLIDIADPGYKYNVFEYQRDFLKVSDDLKTRGVFPIVCGGSGLYVDSVVSAYHMYEVPPDPLLRAELETRSLGELADMLSGFKKLHNVTDIDTKKRAIRAIEIEIFQRKEGGKPASFPGMRVLVAGVSLDRETRRKRISERLKQRMREGMIDEVRNLLESGLSPETLIYYGLEYKHITLYLTGKVTYEKMLSDLETAIHQFAKRQMTWFRGMERKGTIIHWIDGTLPSEQKKHHILDLLWGN